MLQIVKTRQFVPFTDGRIKNTFPNGSISYSESLKASDEEIIAYYRVKGKNSGNAYAEHENTGICARIWAFRDWENEPIILDGKNGWIREFKPEETSISEKEALKRLKSKNIEEFTFVFENIKINVYSSGIRVNKSQFVFWQRSCCHSYILPLRIRQNGKLNEKKRFYIGKDVKTFYNASKSISKHNSDLIFKKGNLSGFILEKPDDLFSIPEIEGKMDRIFEMLDNLFTVSKKE